ncbi:hypothetical protein CROQUDRAFT_667178 [Cronartium quercuum f. sp. fusiforme G11]|uniref:Secreted protein n=1 Tax=Cronartium quercuum f. sp. fusiforme G11 TaxID=708437 RepID=A0A9P6N7W6_9BASI|nr:hypothetical protein CROQUDRAFT_667178 [Cronartium quercuum f. sp. fusiforme G11]
MYMSMFYLSLCCSCIYSHPATLPPTTCTVPQLLCLPLIRSHSPLTTVSLHYTTTTCLWLPPLTLDPIASNLYPLAPIASRSQYSHPSITTIQNLTI